MSILPHPATTTTTTTTVTTGSALAAARTPHGDTALNQLLPYGLAGALAHASPAGSGQMTAADAWRVIRANVWLIVVTVALAGALGVAAQLLLSRYYPRYTAIGYIQVQPSTVHDPMEPSKPVLDDTIIQLEQRTQAQLLRSEALLSSMLSSREEVRKTDWYKGFAAASDQSADWKEDLMERLAVTPVPGTKLVAVSASFPHPRDAKVLVEELVEQHLLEQARLTQSRQLDRSQTLSNAKLRYEVKLKDLGQELREKAVRLNIDGMGTPGRLSAKEVELADLVRRQLDAQLAAARAKAAYESAVAQLQKNIDPPRVTDLMAANSSLMQYKQALDAVDAQLQEAVSRLGEEHPLVRQYQVKRDAYQQKLDTAREEARTNARVTVQESLRNEYEVSQQALDGINRQVQSAKTELGELTSAMSSYLALKQEEEQVRELKKQVDNQLEGLNQVNRGSDLATVSWMTRPVIPDIKSFPLWKTTLPLALILGLALALGIAFLRELMDTSVRSPRDIARVGQMNLLGMICDQADDPESAGARLPLAIHEAPHSMIAEQFRQMRTRLHHAASLDSTHSILVSSPNPEAGTTCVACNLAAGLALNGRRILLVDANFRRPQLHKVFALANETGFGQALTSIEALAGAVQETPVPNLSVMTCGQNPANPSELLDSQLLDSFIERALEQFDHVIFDGGPLLFVSETVAMVPRVDGVVTVVRACADTRGQLQRMRDGLRQIRAQHLGVVLNAVRAQGGGYYGRNIKTYYAYRNGNA